jgi:F-type H+-transporting ATPase subunit b
MIRALTLSLTVSASPALAASYPFFSLRNSDFVVTLGFLVFVGILLYFKVPAKIGAMLDARAVQIKSDLEEARAMRDEAKALLGSYERRQKEMRDQSERMIAAAKAEAEAAATQAKADMHAAIARRLAAAEEQIQAAEASALRAVREQAISVAIAAAGEVLARQMTKEGAQASIDTAIKQVEAKLH